MQPDFADLAAFITALVALAGLGLSIYNFILARRDRLPRLRVKLQNGFLTADRSLSDLMLIIEVANPATTRVTVTSVGIVFNTHLAVWPGRLPGTVAIPFDLDPGKNASFWTPLRNFAHSLYEEGYRRKVRLRARVSSAVGDEFTSRPFTLDLDEWKPGPRTGIPAA